MQISEMLKILCAAPSVSGGETGALDAVNRCAKDAGLTFAPDEAIGSLKAVLNPEADGGVLLLAHMDKIGAMVTGIDEATGFLRIVPVGGMDARVAPAARVTVYGKRALPGVFVSTPPHLMKGDDAKKPLPVEKLTVDCGLPYEEIREIVSPGDRIQYAAPFTELAGGRVAAPYLDNSASVAAFLKAAEALQGKTDRRVEFVLSAREETGKAGATTSAYASNCPVAIAVDVTFASAPGIKETDSAPMGSGARIAYSPIITRRVSDALLDAAKNAGIPYTVEVLGRHTGTDADVAGIAGSGKAMGLVSIPIRNMHTPVETAQLSDIEAAAELLAAYITRAEI